MSAKSTPMYANTRFDDREAIIASTGVVPSSPVIMYRSMRQFHVTAQKEKTVKIKGTNKSAESRIVGCASLTRPPDGFLSELHRRVRSDTPHAYISTSARVIALPKKPTKGPPIIS